MKVTACSFPLQEFEEQIKRWCSEAGEGITYKFAQVGHVASTATLNM